jgi:hypothetical protein
MRPHVPFLSAMIDRLGCQRARLRLRQGRAVPLERPEARGQTSRSGGASRSQVRPVLAALRGRAEGKFDLVICTHTLSLVPLATSTGCSAASTASPAKAVFIAEKIGERKKGEVGTRPTGPSAGRPAVA